MPYIICSHKRSRPKVSLIVCENCTRKKRCPDFLGYLQPALFHLSAERVPKKKRQGNRRTKTEAEPQDAHKQLLLDFE